MKKQVVTTQQTGKSLKLMIVLCVLAEIASICVAIYGFVNASDTEPPMLAFGAVAAFVVALVVHLITKFLIWWNHG